MLLRIRSKKGCEMSKRKIKVEFHLDTNLDSNKLKKVVSFDYGTADCRIEAALLIGLIRSLRTWIMIMNI